MNGQKIIVVALKEIGNTENPANSNMNKYGAWFGLNGVAWCGQFVSWCYFMAGFPLGNIGFTKGYAGCQTMYNYALKNGLITTTPQPGDIVLYDWNGDHRYDHTGIFVKWIDSAHFEAIEGNTGPTNLSNGGKVMDTKRNKSVAIFIHPKVLDNENNNI